MLYMLVHSFGPRGFAQGFAAGTYTFTGDFDPPSMGK
jgi:hypothetical protein